MTHDDDDKKEGQGSSVVKHLAQAVAAGLVLFGAKKAYDNKDEIIQHVNEKFIGIPFMVLGARTVGKTTLFTLIENNLTRDAITGSSNESPKYVPTQPGGVYVSEIDLEVGRKVSLSRTKDLSGELMSIINEWEDNYKNIKPKGIIFIIDHDLSKDSVDKNKIALTHTINTLVRNVAITRSLSSFHIMFNKMDLWKGHTLENFIDVYEEEIDKCKDMGRRFGVNIKCGGVSLITGYSASEFIIDFFNSMWVKESDINQSRDTY